MGTNSETTTVRISRSAHAKLQEMAAASGRSLTEELDHLVEEQRRSWLFEQADAAYARIQSDDAERAELQDEQETLDGTLGDGLEDMEEINA